ncbi:hypothetical protein GA0070611_3121 [Micromonospora auratinigra]|uniref:Uncharacterized protein n=1 Tax=Micromonospora auratinigra TaxID=261654 RepID=A0A1A8ZNP3_9ACTN|nr:hypothetical protein GA0070611_3121 [Micromonospora auratinigra]
MLWFETANGSYWFPQPTLRWTTLCSAQCEAGDIRKAVSCGPARCTGWQNGQVTFLPGERQNNGRGHYL